MRMPMSIAKCNATLLAWKVELARWRAYQNHRYQHVGAPPNCTFQAVATSLTASLLQQSSSKHAALVWCGLNLFIQKCVGLTLASLLGPDRTMLPCETAPLVSCGLL